MSALQIVYLETARDDLNWMRHYYIRVFPEGQSKAREHFRAAERMLLDNPAIGHPTDIGGVRELVIPRTPFSLLYRVTDQIEVLRVWDNRAGGKR